MRLKWSDIPFPPAKVPFFYGWVLLAAATVGIVASIPGQTMGVGIFTDYLMEALGLTRSQLSLAYALGTITSGFLLPWAGRAVDACGIRVTGASSAVGLSLSLVLLSQVAVLVAAMPLPKTTAAMIAVFCCFLALRFFGQGCLTMVSRVAIGKWFNHHRGRAVAIMGIFAAFSFNASPRFLNHLLNSRGWESAALALAAIVGIGMTAVALVFFRNTPEESGLVMDGIPEPVAEEGARAPRATRQFTRHEARRTLAFWAYTLAPAAQGLIMTAITFHMASLGVEAGLTREEAYDVFLPMAFFSVASNIIGGWLSDRIELKWILGFMMVTQMIGIVGLAGLGTPVGRWALIVGCGCSGGLFATMTTVPFPRFFGRVHLGAISGLSLSIMVFGSAIGPYLFSKGLDIFGSYEAAILSCLVLPAAICVLGWIAPDPQSIEPATE